MTVMGLGNAVHWWGWGLTLLSTSSITNIFLVVILKYGQVGRKTLLNNEYEK